RTQSCWKDFTESFENSDLLFLLDIYPAGEKPIEKITSKRLASEIVQTKCTYLDSKEAAKELLIKTLTTDDIFLTLGAGDVYKLGEDLYLRAKK
ncbi:MAG: UDP-N-acetylmuramate--L-alanine ligase, partial [Bdellovibrionales bacterium]